MMLRVARICDVMAERAAKREKAAEAHSAVSLIAVNITTPQTRVCLRCWSCLPEREANIDERNARHSLPPRHVTLLALPQRHARGIRRRQAIRNALIGGRVEAFDGLDCALHGVGCRGCSRV